MVWQLDCGLIMNKTLIPLASYEFELCNSFLHPNFKYLNLDLKDINA
jgi:hypothetical protein